MNRVVFGLLLVGGLGLTGCAGYRLGPVGPLSYRSVAVPMFQNDTPQPQLEAQLTNAILKRLHADGSLRVESESQADVLLRGRITQYSRSALRYVPTDDRAVREYRLIITAEIEARQARTGAVALKRRVLSGQADVFVGSDLQSAELQAVPLAADDLARKVVSLLTESW